MSARILTVCAKILSPTRYKLASRAGMCDLAHCVIGCREIVGHGHNGQPNYSDRLDFPFPAIRWMEPSPEILALREKEKGDWRKLSIEDKKALYRASFRQTFAEMKAPTGEWKSVIGVSLILTSIGIWMYYWIHEMVYKPLPDSFRPENREAQLRRIIDLSVNPMRGISSMWDYENDDWKKNVAAGKSKQPKEGEEEEKEE